MRTGNNDLIISQEKDDPWFSGFTFLLPQSDVHLDPTWVPERLRTCLCLRMFVRACVCVHVCICAWMCECDFALHLIFLNMGWSRGGGGRKKFLVPAYSFLFVPTRRTYLGGGGGGHLERAKFDVPKFGNTKLSQTSPWGHHCDTGGGGGG